MPSFAGCLMVKAIAVCAVVWYEYLLGPLVDGEAKLARAFISGRIEPISEADAALGAAWFNGAGRRRVLKTDAPIAAAAIRAGAAFGTSNRFWSAVCDRYRLKHEHRVSTSPTSSPAMS